VLFSNFPSNVKTQILAVSPLPVSGLDGIASISVTSAGSTAPTVAEGGGIVTGSNSSTAAAGGGMGTSSAVAGDTSQRTSSQAALNPGARSGVAILALAGVLLLVVMVVGANRYYGNRQVDAEYIAAHHDLKLRQQEEEDEANSQIDRTGSIDPDEYSVFHGLSEGSVDGFEIIKGEAPRPPAKLIAPRTVPRGAIKATPDAEPEIKHPSFCGCFQCDSYRFCGMNRSSTKETESPASATPAGTTEAEPEPAHSACCGCMQCESYRCCGMPIEMPTCNPWSSSTPKRVGPSTVPDTVDV